MSRRLSFPLAVCLLLIAAILRLWDVTTLPPGFSDAEITEIRITESVRNGQIGVYYDLGDEGREGLYHMTLATITSLIGHGSLGYRLVSVGAGMVALALVYAIGSRLFGRLAGLTALALMTFGMSPNILARQIIPETLLPALTGVVILALITALPVYRRRRTRGANTTIFAALGIFLGLGLYIHPLGLMLIIACAVFVLYVNYITERKMSRRRNRYVRFALLLMLIITIPYITSSIRQPELNGLSRLFAPDVFTPENVVDSLASVAAVGDDNVLNNLPERPLLDPVSVFLMLFGVAYAVSRWRRSRYAILLFMASILGIGVIFNGNGADFASHAVILPVLYVLVGFGASLLIYLLPRFLLPVGVAGLLILVAFNAAWTLNDLNNWRGSAEMERAYNGDIGRLAHYIDTHTDLPTVICGWDPTQAPNAPQLTDAQQIDLLLNRPNPDLRYADCNNGMVLTDGGGFQRVILPDPTVIESAHPQVRQWLEHGDPITDTQVPNGTVIEMQVGDALADQLGTFTVTTPISFAPETGNTQQFGPPVSFGGNVTFLGYATDDVGTYRPGSIVTLVTYWRVDGVVPPDLRQFTHVLADPGASPPANTDTLAVQARSLKNRDIVVQVTYIPLPETLPAGEYRLSIGAYQDTSRQRLDVLYEGQPFGTRIFLYQINVADSS